MIRHEFTFLTDCFFQKKVPAKGLDPASQALLSGFSNHFEGLKLTRSGKLKVERAIHCTPTYFANTSFPPK